jgi:hypothetical protein
MVTEPVPGNTALLANPIVGFPANAFPFVTDVWFATPSIDLGVNVEPDKTVTSPDPDIPAKDAGRPLRLIVGLPACPSPSAMLRPLPVTAMLRGTIDPETLTANPFPALSRVPEVPFRVIRR